MSSGVLYVLASCSSPPTGDCRLGLVDVGCERRCAEYFHTAPTVQLVPARRRRPRRDRHTARHRDRGKRHRRPAPAPGRAADDACGWRKLQQARCRAHPVEEVQTSRATGTGCGRQGAPARGPRPARRRSAAAGPYRRDAEAGGAGDARRQRPVTVRAPSASPCECAERGRAARARTWDPSLGPHPRGLQAGIEDLASRIAVPFSANFSVGRFPPAIEATAYFVVAEALTNVVKHASADSAAIKTSAEGVLLWVEVRDDGVGGARQTATACWVSRTAFRRSTAGSGVDQSPRRRDPHRRRDPRADAASSPGYRKRAASSGSAAPARLRSRRPRARPRGVPERSESSDGNLFARDALVRIAGDAVGVLPVALLRVLHDGRERVGVAHGRFVRARPERDQ